MLFRPNLLDLGTHRRPTPTTLRLIRRAFATPMAPKRGSRMGHHPQTNKLPFLHSPAQIDQAHNVNGTITRRTNPSVFGESACPTHLCTCGHRCLRIREIWVQHRGTAPRNRVGYFSVTVGLANIELLLSRYFEQNRAFPRHVLSCHAIIALLEGGPILG